MAKADRFWQSCEKCDHMMSMDAQACPECGHRLKSSSHAGRKAAGAIIVLLIIGAGFVLAFPEYSPVKIPDNPATSFAAAVRADIAGGSFPEKTQEITGEMLSSA